MAEVAAMQRYIPCGLYFPGGSVYPGDSNLAWYKHFCCKHKQHLIQILEEERMEIMALCFIVPGQTMAASGLSLSCVVSQTLLHEQHSIHWEKSSRAQHDRGQALAYPTSEWLGIDFSDLEQNLQHLLWHLCTVSATLRPQCALGFVSFAQ